MGASALQRVEFPLYGLASLGFLSQLLGKQHTFAVQPPKLAAPERGIFGQGHSRLHWLLGDLSKSTQKLLCQIEAVLSEQQWKKCAARLLIHGEVAKGASPQIQKGPPGINGGSTQPSYRNELAIQNI